MLASDVPVHCCSFSYINSILIGRRSKDPVVAVSVTDCLQSVVCGHAGGRFYLSILYIALTYFGPKVTYGYSIEIILEQAFFQLSYPICADC